MEKFRPIIFLSAAMTLDGKIATRTGDSKLSSKQDQIRLHRLRAKVDAILIGKKTVQRDDPILSVRHVKGKNPIRVILDSMGKINSNSKIVKTSDKIPTIIVVSKKISKNNLNRLRKLPLEIIVSGNKSVDVKKLLKILWKKKIKKILLEGGGTVNWEFVRNGLIDEVIISINPSLAGGKIATTLVDGKGFNTMAESMKLKLQKVQRIKNELILNYNRY